MSTSRALVVREQRSQAVGFLAGTERDRSFVLARRHSRLVRVLRVALPVISVLVLVGYGVVVMKESGGFAGLQAAAIQKILPKNLKMENPHYDGYGKDGSAYVVDAKAAQQDLAKPDLILLEEITATLTQPDKTKTLVTATVGEFNHKTNILELTQAIDVNSESGMKAKLTQATIRTKDNVVVSREPVVVEYPSGSVHSQSMVLRQKQREVEFSGSVVTRLTPPPEEKQEGASPVAEAASAVVAVASGAEGGAAQGASMFKPSSEPIVINSQRLEVKDAESRATFTGAVKVEQGQSTLESPELVVTYENEKEAGGAATKPVAAGGAMASGKVKTIVAKGPVVMMQPDGQRVDAENAEFNAKTETAVLAGNVVMSGTDGQSATSDRVDLDQRADTALLTGNVVVLQNENELKGRRLFINRKEGTAQLTSPPGEGAGPGRITAHFTQDRPKAKARAKAKAAGSADAGTPAAAGGLGTFKTSPDAPIDIEADVLDVNDAKHEAIFRGDVHAVQGDFVIRTSEMVAHYTGGGKLADVTGAAETGAGQKNKEGEGGLTRIDAKKNVVVTSKDGQMARGDWATYDAAANTVTMGGDVTLSRGENMVRGTQLVIDMVSGESTIATDPNLPNAKPGAGGWSTTGAEAGQAGNRGRPSAIIFPKALREATGAKKEDGGKSKPATSGWNAQTAPGGPAP